MSSEGKSNVPEQAVCQGGLFNEASWLPEAETQLRPISAIKDFVFCCCYCLLVFNRSW